MVPNLAVPSSVRILCLLLFSLVHLSCCLCSSPLCCPACSSCWCNGVVVVVVGIGGSDDCVELLLAVVVEVDSTDECGIFCCAVVVCSLGNICFSFNFFSKQKQKALLKQNTHKIEVKKMMKWTIFGCSYV